MTEKPKTLTLNTAKYQHLLDTCDLTDAEKQAFLAALWQVIVAFVDLGFSVEPCEELAENQTLEASDMVHLTHVPNDTRNEAAHE